MLSVMVVAMAVPAVALAGAGRQRQRRSLFNVENVAAVNRIVTTTSSGELTSPLPSPFPPRSGYDQVQMQIGFKFVF
jgi:hypothetical protein